ncbi:hypothetical protein, partial [Nocardia brasiliensis]|uniref:hypothetical protein n=1 Tax=Nocardia brasiliensis TaxID=37326 RepID=UPI0024559677
MGRGLGRAAAVVQGEEVKAAGVPQPALGPVQSIAAVPDATVDLAPVRISGAEVADAVYRVVATGFD